MHLLNKSLKSWFDGKRFRWEKNSVISTVWALLTKFWLTIFSWNQIMFLFRLSLRINFRRLEKSSHACHQKQMHVPRPQSNWHFYGLSRNNWKPAASRVVSVIRRRQSKTLPTAFMASAGALWSASVSSTLQGAAALWRTASTLRKSCSSPNRTLRNLASKRIPGS